MIQTDNDTDRVITRCLGVRGRYSRKWISVDTMKHPNAAIMRDTPNRTSYEHRIYTWSSKRKLQLYYRLLPPGGTRY